MAHPRVSKARQRSRDAADHSLHQHTNHRADRERYAELLHRGHANLDTIRELNEIGRRLGKSAAQIEIDARLLARPKQTAIASGGKTHR